MDPAELQEWNRKHVELSEALIGWISPNFRMVVLDRKGGRWTILFYLEREDDEDREAIEDILVDFEVQQEGILDYDDEVFITTGPLPRAQFPGRAVYLRRERDPDDDDLEEDDLG